MVDFEGIFKAMNGKPVTIRLVDPPLHEFLPHTPADKKKLAQHAGVSVDFVEQRAEQLHESNPDAWTPWLPLEHHVPGNPGDASASNH